MRKQLVTMLTLGLLAASGSLYAADLAEDMHTLKDGLNVVTKTHDAQEMQKALGEMRQAAEDSKKSLPEKLAGQPADSMQVKEYIADLDSLIAEIDVVNELAKANKVDEAQAEAKKLADIRNASHKKFR